MCHPLKNAFVCKKVSLNVARHWSHLFWKGCWLERVRLPLPLLLCRSTSSVREVWLPLTPPAGNLNGFGIVPLLWDAVPEKFETKILSFNHRFYADRSFFEGVLLLACHYYLRRKETLGNFLEIIWKTLPENGICSCVLVCLRSLGRLERCGLTNHYSGVLIAL